MTQPTRAAAACSRAAYVHAYNYAAVTALWSLILVPHARASRSHALPIVPHGRHPAPMHCVGYSICTGGHPAPLHCRLYLTGGIPLSCTADCTSRDASRSLALPIVQSSPVPVASAVW